MNLKNPTIEKRKGASLVRMMRPVLRRERLVLRPQPAFATSGVEVPFEATVLVGEGKQPVVAATIFDTDAVDGHLEIVNATNGALVRVACPPDSVLHGHGDGSALVAKPESVEELLPRRTCGDLALCCVGHNDLLTMCISLVRGGKYYPVAPRSHLPIPSRNSTISIADCCQSVKSKNRVGLNSRKSPYFRAFLWFSYWIKNFSSPQFKTWFAPMFFPGSFAVFASSKEATVSSFSLTANARNSSSCA